MPLARTATSQNYTPITVTSTAMVFASSPTFNTSVEVGDKVLFKSQDSEEQNGLWVCQNASRTNWQRSADADTWNELRKLQITITVGPYADTLWHTNITENGLLGTNPIIFERIVDEQADAEVVTSIPLVKPTHKVKIDITPHGSVVSHGAYTWPAQDIPGLEEEAVPAMFYHAINEELTFHATPIKGIDPIDIVEYLWDLGDGTEAIGQTVTHTYRAASPEFVVHCRARARNGDLAWASMNPMLLPSVSIGAPEGIPFNAGWIHVDADLSPSTAVGPLLFELSGDNVKLPDDYGGLALTPDDYAGTGTNAPRPRGYYQDYVESLSGLISWYKTEDTTGTTVPDALGNNDGTVVTNVTKGGPTTYSGYYPLDTWKSYDFGARFTPVNLTLTAAASEGSNFLAGTGASGEACLNVYVITGHPNTGVDGPGDHYPAVGVSEIQWIEIPAGATQPTIDLTWDAMAGADFYKIHRITVPGTYADLTSNDREYYIQKGWAGSFWYGTRRGSTTGTTFHDAYAAKVENSSTGTPFTFVAKEAGKVDLGTAYSFGGTTPFTISLGLRANALDFYSGTNTVNTFHIADKSIIQTGAGFDEWGVTAWVTSDASAPKIALYRYADSVGSYSDRNVILGDANITKGQAYISYDGSQVRIGYGEIGDAQTVDGIYFTTAVISDTAAMPTTPIDRLYIGGDGPSGDVYDFWLGNIGDIQIYDFAMTDTQMEEHIRAQLDVYSSQSRGYVYLDGDPVVDGTWSLQFTPGSPVEDYAPGSYLSSIGISQASGAPQYSLILKSKSDRSSWLQIGVYYYDGIYLDLMEMRPGDYWWTVIGTLSGGFADSGYAGSQLPIWEKDQDYWIVAHTSGNTITVEFWDSDPEGTGAPVFSGSVELTDPDQIAKFGAGVEGYIGIGEWAAAPGGLIKSVKLISE